MGRLPMLGPSKNRDLDHPVLISLEAREQTLTSAAIWAELPDNRTNHVEGILAELRERMMRYEAGEPPAPETGKSKAEAEKRSQLARLAGAVRDVGVQVVSEVLVKAAEHAVGLG